MKSLITSFALLFFANTLFSQNPSIQTYFNDSEPWISQIYNYPGDPTSLIAVHQEYNGSDFVYQLVIPDIGSANPVWISGCTEVTSTLNEVSGGAVLSGNFTGQGNELFFFNGFNPTVFDLNPGVGDSDPEIFQLNDGLFITAFDGIARQLYHFISPTELVKVTNETNDVFLPIGKINDDYLYQMSKETLPNQVQWELKCARENGGVFTYSIVRTATFPVVSGNPSVTPDGLVWVNGLNANGQYFLIEDVLNYQISSKDFYVLSYSEQTQQVTEVDQSLGHGNSGSSELFEFENDVCWYVSGMTELRRSSNGINFNIDMNSQTNMNEQIINTHLSENGVLWTIRRLPNDSEVLVSYSSGQLSSAVPGNHFHFSLENQGKLYLTDFSLFLDAHYLLEVDVMSGSIEDYFIDSNYFHSPTEHASVMLNGLFTFLYEREDPQHSVDILQIDGVDLGVLENLDDAFLVYPNPSNGTFTIHSNMEDPTVKVYSSLGTLVYEGEPVLGNQLTISDVTEGIYVIELSNKAQSVRSKIRFY